MSHSAQDQERFSAYPVLGSARPSWGQGCAEPKTDRRALLIGLGASIHRGVCLSPGLASVFGHHALVRRSGACMRRVFAPPSALG
jgi:hypothetical protein